MTQTEYHQFLTAEQEKTLARQRKYSENRACIELYSTDIGRILLAHTAQKIIDKPIDERVLIKIKCTKSDIEQLHEMICTMQNTLRDIYANQIIVPKKQQRKIGAVVSRFGIARRFLHTILEKTKQLYQSEDIPDYCSQSLTEARAAITSAWKSYEQRKKAVNTLAECHQPFAKYFAKKHKGKGLSLDDLIGESNIGLIDAGETFDDQKKTRFTTHAGWCIKNKITKALRNKARNVRIPEILYDLNARIDEAVEHFLKTRERKPTLHELAQLFDKPVEIIQNAILTTQPERSLYNYVSSNGRTKKQENSTEQYEQVHNLLSMLSDEQRELLEERLGINGQAKKLEEYGIQKGISGERVRQKQSIALKTLAQIIRDKKLFTSYGQPLPDKYLRIKKVTDKTQQVTHKTKLALFEEQIKHADNIIEICEKVYKE